VELCVQDGEGGRGCLWRKAVEREEDGWEWKEGGCVGRRRRRRRRRGGYFRRWVDGWCETCLKRVR